MHQTNSEQSRRVRSVAETLGATGVPKGDAGFLVCDGQGRVVLCSNAAAELYRGRPSDLERAMLAALLPGTSHIGMSGSHVTRNLERLGRAGWRRYHALGVHGGRFPIEVAVSEFNLDDARFFVLRLRHSGQA